MKDQKCCEELARAYFKVQEFGRVFKPADGLMKGTIFPDLYQPYDAKTGYKDSSLSFRGGMRRG